MKVGLVNEDSFLRNTKRPSLACADKTSIRLRWVSRLTVSPQRRKDRVKEPTHARNHDDDKIPRQMLANVKDPNDAPQSAGLDFSLRTSHGRIENDSDNCPLAQAAPVQSTNRSLSCVVLCHLSQSKELGPSTQVTGNPTFRLQTIKKGGAGYCHYPPGP